MTLCAQRETTRVQRDVIIPAPRTLSIVVPVYWNEDSLPLLFNEVTRVETALSCRGYRLELIIVDDGSGDKSFERMLKIKEDRPETRLIKLTRNFGAVHAAKTGFGLVTGDCFMVLAADLQDPPELIMQMLEKREAGSKFVVCTRIARRDPFVTRMFSALYYWLLRYLVVPGYPRGGFDLALMDRAFLPYLLQCGKNVNPPLFAFWLGFRPEIIFYHRRGRQFGKSRWTFSKKLKHFLDSMLGFSILPIRMISLVGVSVSFLSFAYGFIILFNTLVGRGAVPGFATIVALLSFLLGMVIVMLGIVGEYLWRIFDETNKRPEAVIDEIY